MESLLADLLAIEPVWIGIFLMLGAGVGLAAGLFGIGGGGIMVPLLTLIFIRLGFPPYAIVHMALASSMAVIVATAISSTTAHVRHNAVRWSVVVAMAPGVLAGTFLAARITTWIPSGFLAVLFVLFIGYVSVRMLMEIAPTPDRQLPAWPGQSLAGAGIGSISALVAIGGGSLTVPWLVWCNVPIHRAIGTSAAVGIPISIAGTAGYLVAGAAIPGLPDGAFGYIYLPAVLPMAFMSLLTAPLGAALAHRLPVLMLRRLFAILLMILALQMLYRVVMS